MREVAKGSVLLSDWPDEVERGRKVATGARMKSGVLAGIVVVVAGILFLMVNVFATPYARSVSLGCDGLHEMIAGHNHGDLNEYSQGTSTFVAAAADLDDHTVPNADTLQDQTAIWEAAYTLGFGKRAKVVQLSAEEQSTVELGLAACRDY